MANPTRRRWPFVLGGILALIVIVVLVFQWDWLLPLVDSRASAALGRPVKAEHLQVSLGRTTRIELTGITIANPPGWPGGGDFATIQRLGLDFDAMAYIQHRQIVLPVIDLQSPKVDAQQLADGRANWTITPSDTNSSGSGSGPGPKLGTLRIADGHAHVVDDKLSADVQVDVATQDSANGRGQIVATVAGTYAKQPIKAEFSGGAVLSLRDAKTPYPISLKLANGPTHISLVGTVQNPLAFAGADLTLDLAGPDMSLLLPLTGIAIPKTPPYEVKGKLDYDAGLVKFDGIEGKVGSSDLEGNLSVDTKPKRPVVTADLRSNTVDLKDLGGFIGAQPGDSSKGTKAPVRSNGKVLPGTPISLPKLNVADVHLKYHAKRVEGRRQPIDNMTADLDIVNGAVHLHPLDFGIGGGTIESDIALSPEKKDVHAKVKVDFHRIPINNLLSAAGVGHGAGTLGGQAAIDGTGDSVAAILGHGNGDLRLFVGAGGNLSALLVDLSGLEFGNALLSALGIPNRAKLECLAANVELRQGVAVANPFVVETDEAKVGIKGEANLRTEALDFTLKTTAKHFSIGSLPTPIEIKGMMGKPSIAPAVGPLAARGAAAIALGIIGTPLAALLPTIQLGTGEDHACAGLLKTAEAPAHAPARAAETRHK